MRFLCLPEVLRLCLGAALDVCISIFSNEGIQSASLYIFLLLFFYYLNASWHLPTNIEKKCVVHQKRIVFYTITSFFLHHYIIMVSITRCWAASCLPALLFLLD